MKLTLLLQIAGVLHVGLAAAGALMPRVVQMREHLATLPVFLRRLFLVYYTFIALCLVAFGALTFFHAGELASGEPLARALCLFFVIFWTVRLIAAAFIFDVRPYLTNGWLRLGYHATNAVFIYLLGVYVFALCRGGAW